MVLSGKLDSHYFIITRILAPPVVARFSHKICYRFLANTHKHLPLLIYMHVQKQAACTNTHRQFLRKFTPIYEDPAVRLANSPAPLQTQVQKPTSTPNPAQVPAPTSVQAPLP